MRSLKKKVVVLLIIASTVAAGIGCKKALVKIFPGLVTEVPEIIVIVPFFPLPPGFPVPSSEIAFPGFTQHFNLDSSVRVSSSGNFNASDVSSIKIKQIVLTIQNPDFANNLSNFETVRFTLQSNSNTTPLPLGSFSFPDTYTTTATYIAPADTPELRSYLDGTELTYTVYGKLRRFTTKDLEVSVRIALTVK